MAPAPKTLVEAITYFADLDNCIDYLANRRWPKGVTCPTCGRADVSYVPSRRLWQCKTRHPKAQFSVKTGSVLEESLIGLDKWMPVMWMVANCKNGVSSWEIHRSLGVSQKTAWFMLHRIRLGMQSKDGGKLGGGSGNKVEIDETFIGGKARNMHKSRRQRMTTIGKYAAKTAVMGLLERGGKVQTHVLGQRVGKKMQEIVRDSVVPGTWLMTDEFSGYNGLSDNYTHLVVNHLERYAQGNVHTNGMENFWSLLKRGLGGTYVAVEPFHLFRYVDEQAFRFNNRGTRENPVNDSDRFSLLCSQIVGKRLTYAELTAKEDKKPEATSF
jgi:transposase-like protein